MYTYDHQRNHEQIISATSHASVNPIHCGKLAIVDQTSSNTIKEINTYPNRNLQIDIMLPKTTKNCQAHLWDMTKQNMDQLGNFNLRLGNVFIMTSTAWSRE